MFLHCQVKLCDHNEQQCNRSCPARRRRSGTELLGTDLSGTVIGDHTTAELVVPLKIGKTRPPPRSRLSRIFSFLRHRG